MHLPGYFHPISLLSIFLLSLVPGQLRAVSPEGEVLFEAESGEIRAPMVVGEAEEASGGGYIFVPPEAGEVANREDARGRARYSVEVPATGTYTLWAKVFTPGAPREQEHSFFVEIAGRKYTWIVHDWADSWVWRRITLADRTHEVRFQLEKGTYRLDLGHRGTGTRIDQLKLVPADQSLSPELAAARNIRARDTKVYHDLSPYFPMPDLVVPSFPDRDFDIREFGAVEGGETMVTEAIRAAVEACFDAGGGRVVIPSGEWLTGPIHLRSNVNLHISEGALVKFSKNIDDYLPAVFTRWEGMECMNYSAPIYARGATNIALTGDGILDGQGEAWWDWKQSRQGVGARRLYELIVAGVPPHERLVANEDFSLRPNFVQFINCRNVLVENVTLSNGPMWTIHPIYCTNMVVRGVKVVTVGPNNDGINPDSTQELLIEDCYFSTGDDCVVLKAGLNEDGWRVDRPTQNVVIRNVYGNEGHGGVVVGSEMSGSVRNVYAHDLYFEGTDRGIRFKSMRGRGGVVENVWIENVRMRNIGGEAIRLNMFYSSSTVQPLTDTPALFRNIHMRNIFCDGAARAIDLIGLPEAAIENISLTDAHITANQGASIIDGNNIRLRNVTIEPETGPVYDLLNSRHVIIANPGEGAMPGGFLRAEGPRSGNIRVSDWRASVGLPAPMLGEEVDPEAVVFD